MTTLLKVTLPMIMMSTGNIVFPECARYDARTTDLNLLSALPDEGG
jgi:hypothetical protein